MVLNNYFPSKIGLFVCNIGLQGTHFRLHFYNKNVYIYIYIYVLLKNTFLHDVVRQNFLKDLSFTIVPLKIILWVFSLKFEVNLRLTARN